MTTVAVEGVDVWMGALLQELANRRRTLGLTQAELAERIGVNRMTVQRAEGEDADPQLSTFVAMTLAMNMAPSLELPKTENIAPADLVHRGYSYERTKYDLQYLDRQREAALAAAWEKFNAFDPAGGGSAITALIPNCTQEQASAAATIAQWMGSGIGFKFLTDALASVGYEIVEKSAKKK